MSIKIQFLLHYYRKYLAKYFIFRFFRSVSTHLYFYMRAIYFILFRKSQTYNRRLISFSEYAKKSFLKAILVLPSQVESIDKPRFFPSHLAQPVLVEQALQLTSPKLEITYLPNAMTFGGSYLTILGGFAIYPDLFDPDMDRSPLETFGVARIDRKNKSVFLLQTQSAVKVDIAINLLGQNAGNYAHWLTELLPKLAIVNQYEELNNHALLVDSWIHPNLHESINWLNGQNRQVVYVNRWQPVKADQLIDISLPGYEPYIPQELFAKDRAIYVNSFSKFALNVLREQCYVLANSEDLKAGAKKIYLKRSVRSSNVRRVSNIEELEHILLKYEFEFIESETLNFKEQVAACLNAEVVVGAVGAALANIIFAPKGCKVLALAPYYKHGNYYYYSNLAASLDHDLAYVLGQPLDNGNHPMHQDYYIDKNEFSEAIKQALSRVSHI